MAYGTASGPDDVERYYTDIRGGRPPTPEHLQELKDRYAAIGNRFPLLEITRQQASGLERMLNEAAADGRPGFRSYLGMKHSPPFIREGVAAMRADGIERAVGLVMAPHWSGMSVETYVDRVQRAVAEQGGGPSFTFVRHWYDHPLFVELLAARVRATRHQLDPSVRDRAVVILSAHSLPTRTLPDGTRRCKYCSFCEGGCRYLEQLERTVHLVAERVGRGGYLWAWQSAGRTGDPWWGPTLEEVIGDVAEAGYPAAVVCSAGFVADHLEILYDVDIEAREYAEKLGLAFARTEMPNADPAFLEALAAVVRDHLAEEGPA